MERNGQESITARALGELPKQNFERAFNCVTTVVGSGIGSVGVDALFNAARSQHAVLNASNFLIDQMYVHKVHVYGTSGGYLSLAPYPHRQYLGPPGSPDTISRYYNCYERAGESTTDFISGSLQQTYSQAVSGATRPELSFDWPEAEILNNPFNIQAQDIPLGGGNKQQVSNSLCKVITVESADTSGGALWIAQFHVTFRSSQFIEAAPSFGLLAYGGEHCLIDNYTLPSDEEKRKADGEKAQEMANKKRKVNSVKQLTLPPLDSK